MKKIAGNNYSKSIQNIEADIEHKKQQLRDAYLSLKQKTGTPTILLGGLAGGLVVGYFIFKRKKGGFKAKPSALSIKKHPMASGILDLVSLFNVFKYVGSFLSPTKNSSHPSSQTSANTSKESSTAFHAGSADGPSAMRAGGPRSQREML